MYSLVDFNLLINCFEIFSMLYLYYIAVSNRVDVLLCMVHFFLRKSTVFLSCNFNCIELIIGLHIIVVSLLVYGCDV